MSHVGSIFNLRYTSQDPRISKCHHLLSSLDNTPLSVGGCRLVTVGRHMGETRDRPCKASDVVRYSKSTRGGVICGRRTACSGTLKEYYKCVKGIMRQKRKSVLGSGPVSEVTRKQCGFEGPAGIHMSPV